MAGKVLAQSGKAGIRPDADGAFGSSANLKSAFPIGRVIVIGALMREHCDPVDTEMASSGGHTI
jgi:hypothetical protein